MINKSVLPATNDFKTITSVYIKLHDDKILMDKDIKKASKNGLNPIVCTGLCSDCLICYGPIKKHYTLFELTKKEQQKEKKGLIKNE